MSPELDRSPEPLVYIATAPNDITASLWKGVLEENQIPFFFNSLNLAVSLYTSPANEQSELYVLASDAERSREALAPFLEDEAEDVKNPR